MADKYPFTGMDMLQQSMASMIAELRNVSTSINESARSFSSASLHGAANLSGTMQNMNQSLISGSAGVMGGMQKSASFASETFSSQFNKPSLWSRDLVAMMGLRSYEDTYKDEAKRYAMHNWGNRLEMGGMKTAGFGASMLAFGAMGSFLPGMAASAVVDKTFGEFILNKQQENDWWSYLDKAGKNNALLGRGGTGRGWGSDGNMDTMANMLSKQDKAWYNKGMMSQDKLQSTVMSAEMSGYFLNTVDPKEFKNKVEKLQVDTMELVKTMKTTHEAAAQMLGELSLAGFKSPVGSIKEMNKTAAMTGLNFSDIKSFGMEYANQQYASLGITRDEGLATAMGIMRKYDKRTMEGASGELQLMGQATAAPHLMWGATKYNPITQNFEMDEESMNQMATMSPVQLMQLTTKKMRDLRQATGSEGEFATRMMQLQSNGQALLQSASPGTLQKFYLGASMPAIKTSMEMLYPERWKELQSMGGSDPYGFLQYTTKQETEMMVAQIEKQTGLSKDQARKIIDANKYGDKQDMDAPMSLDDVRGNHERIGGHWYNPLYSDETNKATGWRDADNKWSLRESLMGKIIQQNEYVTPDGRFRPHQKTTQETLGDSKFRRLAPGSSQSITGQMFFNAAMNNDSWDSEMSAVEDRLKAVTGSGRWDSMFGDRSHNLIMAMGAASFGVTNYQAQEIIQKNYAEYAMEKMGKSELEAEAWGKRQGNVAGIQQVMLGTYTGKDKEFARSWEKKFKGMTTGGVSLWDRNIGSAEVGTMNQVDIIAMRGALNTKEMALAIRDQYGQGALPTELWSPELVRQNAGSFAASNKTAFVQSIYDQSLEEFDKDFTRLGSKEGKRARKLFEELQSEKKTNKIVTKGTELITMLAKGGESWEDIGAKLSTIKGVNVDAAGVLAELPMGNMTFGRYEAGREVMGTLMDSKFVDLFGSGSVASLLGEIGKKDSIFYQQAKADPGKMADTLTQRAKQEAVRAGKAMSREDEKGFRAQAVQALQGVVAPGGDRGMLEFTAIANEQAAASGDIGRAISISNQHLAVIAGAAEDGALKVVLGKGVYSRDFFASEGKK